MPGMSAGPTEGDEVSEFWQWVLGLFAVGGVLVWVAMRGVRIGRRRADWELSSVLFGWFFASAGVAVALWAGYCFYVAFLSTECRDPANGLPCGIAASVFLASLVASLVPLGIGALLLRLAPRR
jgi:hypothetical protein